MNVNRYISSGKKIRAWDVDRILDRKTVGGKARYLVKWRRTFNELNTWELRESFSDPSLIEKFEAGIDRSRRIAENLSRRSTSTATGTRNRSVEESKTSTSVTEECLASAESCLNGEKVKIFRKLMETELQCCICQEIFQNPCVTECEHIFCDKCIDQWKNINRTCPICRAVLFRSEKKLVRIDNFITKAAQVLKE